MPTEHAAPTEPGWYRYKPVEEEDGWVDWYWLDAGVWACIEVLPSTQDPDEKEMSAVILLYEVEGPLPTYVPVGKLRGQWGARIEFEEKAE